jgi:hypothetical protein
MARLLGGELEATSRVDVGSTFTLDLPATVVDPPTDTPPQDATAQGRPTVHA